MAAAQRRIDPSPCARCEGHGSVVVETVELRPQAGHRTSKTVGRIWKRPCFWCAGSGYQPHVYLCPACAGIYSEHTAADAGWNAAGRVFGCPGCRHLLRRVRD